MTIQVSVDWIPSMPLASSCQSLELRHVYLTRKVVPQDTLQDLERHAVGHLAPDLDVTRSLVLGDVLSAPREQVLRSQLSAGQERADRCHHFDLRGVRNSHHCDFIDQRVRAYLLLDLA